MPREKVDYQENLRLILERFGNVQLIPLKKAAEYCGTDARSLQRDKDFPVKKIMSHYYVPVVGLARWMS